MIRRFLTKLLISYLSRPAISKAKPISSDPKLFKDALRPGDVILVEGCQKFSSFIKYLTQSNWSHSALYIGPLSKEVYGEAENGEPYEIIEADIKEGIRLLPVSYYYDFHTRICRPENLSKDDLETVKQHCIDKLGYSYDLKNVFDLLRYLLPLPFLFPQNWGKDILEFGSGDPTKVICSSLIAEAFQKVHFPVLPLVVKSKKKTFYRKIKPSLYTPSDFDRSPYFQVVKPTIVSKFNYQDIKWKK